MKEKADTSYILQRLEPSSELKRRVMERASKLEAGRKTFGNERTTTDNRQIQKEQITMNAFSTKETAYVKKRFHVAAISAACAALVIGIATVGLNRSKIEQLNDNGFPNSSAEQIEKQESSSAGKQNTAVSDVTISENELAVTKVIGSPYIITDENRIAAINALVEKAMGYPVRTDEPSPVCRTIEYYADGEKRTVELSDESYPVYSDQEDTVYLTVTVNGTQYLMEQDALDSPYYDLKYATDNDSPLLVIGNNYGYSSESEDDTAFSRTLGIIEDIRKNGAQQTGAGRPELSTDLGLSFTRDGKNYSIELYYEGDMIGIQANGCIGDEPHYTLYKDARKWMDEVVGVIESLESTDNDLDINNYLYNIDVFNNPDTVGYIRIPGLESSQGWEYISNVVLQHDDNEYYTSHDWAERTTDAGNIFADCAVPVIGGKRADNITLYGNNVRTLGTMFTHLTDFNDGTGEKLNECPEILFGTVRDDVLSRYAIIGVGCVRVDTDDCFDYSGYHDFDNDRYSFDSWITGINNNCTIMRDIDCTADDDYLTLSTTIPADNADGYRFVVFSRKLRDGEELSENGFNVIRDRLFVTPPNEEVPLPELFGLTEEQAAATLKEAGLNCIIEYRFDSTEKGYVSSYYDPYFDAGSGDLVCKGANVWVDISLGEYDGPTTEPTDEYPYSMPVFENIKLEVPVPDGLSGSYTFSIFSGNTAMYTDSVDDIKGVKNIVFDTNEMDKMRLAVYAKNNDAKDGRFIRYADYEADHANNTYKLIGELNTDELLKTMK